jgi:predicted nucleic acid-binding protein
MRRIYVDSNVLIAHYSVDKSEETKREMVTRALSVFAQLKDVQLCTSIWAVTEMVNILTSNKKMDSAQVAAIENQLTNERRLQGLRMQILQASPQKDYDLGEFFYHVRVATLSYHSGLGDIIHSVIMKNNAVDHILTFDEKDDFKRIPGLTVMHPKDIKLP